VLFFRDDSGSHQQTLLYTLVGVDQEPHTMVGVDQAPHTPSVLFGPAELPFYFYFFLFLFYFYII
jgi:hypothetical protein